MNIERSTIESPSWGIQVDTPNVVTFVRRTRITDPLAYRVRATNGAIANVHNSLITVDDGYAFSIQTQDTNTLISARGTSPSSIREGSDDAVIQIGDGLTADGSINAVIDTIIAGQDDPIDCNTPMTSTTMTLRYTWFFHSVIANGDCTFNTFNTLDSFDPMVGPPCSGRSSAYRPARPASTAATPGGDPADGGPRRRAASGGRQRRRGRQAGHRRLRVPAARPGEAGRPGDPHQPHREEVQEEAGEEEERERGEEEAEVQAQEAP